MCRFLSRSGLGIVEPCTYISTRAGTNAFSLRWKRSNRAVENCPERRAHPELDLPTRVINRRS